MSVIHSIRPRHSAEAVADHATNLLYATADQAEEGPAEVTNETVTLC